MNFVQQSGVYKFEWPDYLIRIAVRQLHQHRAGHVTGDITVETDAPGYPSPLHGALFNLSSTNTRTQLAKYLTQRYEHADWTGILEELCNTTLQAFRQGEDVVELFSIEERGEPPYLLEPFLFVNKPTVIFGDGGKGKSQLAILISMTLSLPWSDNDLGLGTNGTHRTKVLYLDYEADESDVAWNMGRFKNGLNIPEVSINYRRCSFPLANDVEEIQRIVAEQGIGCIVVDSLGMACGGELNTAETAMRFWNAQRQLKNVTTLVIAHPQKESLGKKATIHGSGFFSHEARSVWELKQTQEPGEDDISIGLFHRKVNVGKIHKPLGFRLTFSPHNIKVEKQEVFEVREFRQEMGTQAQIMGLLKNGAMNVSALKNELEVSENAVRQALSKLSKRNKILKVDDRWGLCLS